MLFFHLLLFFSIFIVICFWVFRFISLEDFYNIVTNKCSNCYNFKDGYNYSIRYDYERIILDKFNRCTNKMIFAFYFLFSFICLPGSFLAEVLDSYPKNDLCFISFVVWYCAWFIIEIFWYKIIYALKDRAYLVLRQYQENEILFDSDLSDDKKVSIIISYRDHN